MRFEDPSRMSRWADAGLESLYGGISYSDVLRAYEVVWTVLVSRGSGHRETIAF